MPDAPAQPLAVVPDTNVLIHGRALHELPWSELAVEEIEVLIVGPVLRELDALKTRAGRPGRIARDVSCELRALLAGPEEGDVIAQAGPRVTRRLWLGDEARTPVRDGIDVTHGDLAIINRALWLLDRGRDVLLLTDDTLAAAHAKEFGLPFRLLDEAWLRAPEADEAQKEVARLKAEIARVRSTEPVLRGWFVDEVGEPVERVDATLGRHLAVEESQVEELMERVLKANPMAPELPSPAKPAPRPPGPVDLAFIDADMDRHFSPILERADRKYREEYASWTDAVRRKLADLHREWDRRRRWPRLTLMASNEGSRPAEEALVEIVVQGDFTVMRPTKWKGDAAKMERAKRDTGLSIPMPPTPPIRQTAASLLLGHARNVDLLRSPFAHGPLLGLSRTRDADAFYWRTGRGEPVRSLELDCASWRHAREPEDFPFVVGGRDDAPVRGLVVGRLSAANLGTPVEVRLPVRIGFEDKPMAKIAEEMVGEFERVSPIWRRGQRLPPAESSDAAT